MVSLKDRLLYNTSFIMLTVWIILSVIASLDSLAALGFIFFTIAIDDSASYFSLKNFSMLSLSFIILSRFVELSLFSVRADEADPSLSNFAGDGSLTSWLSPRTILLTI